MIQAKDIPRRPAHSFDNAWLSRCQEQHLPHPLDDKAIRLSLLLDLDAPARYLARSALLADAEACEALQRELRVGARLSSDWAMVPLAQLWTSDRLVAIYSDAAPLSRSVALDVFFHRFVDTARALSGLHAERLVHGGVHAGSFLADAQESIRLFDFSSSVAMGAQEHGAGYGPAYRAPELDRAPVCLPTTGSDLYALGVTAYEWLCGELPLSANSPAEWKYAHLAIEPQAPHIRRQDVPPQLSRIVMKLLAKEARARYASAASLLADLQRCRDQWQATGTIDAFELDNSAAFTMLRSGERLFGRSPAMDTLDRALERVAITGDSELLLVSGVAGVGKSALCRWLLAKARAQGLRAGEGKSDHLQMTIPFAPVRDVVKALTMQVLGEDAATLARLRERWLDLLGGLGQTMVELVPEAEHVLGKTHPLADVSAARGQERMENALLRTFATFALRGLPAVIFLDDLQWADAPTLGFLQAFLSHAPGNLLVVGALRDNAPGIVARLREMQHARRSEAVGITEIRLDALSVANVAAMVASALDEHEATLEPVARAIHEASGGNPFFAQQLLQTWIDDGVLARTRSGNWHWDKGAALSDGVYADHAVGLMIQRFSRLSPASLDVLKHMACIGIRCHDALLPRVAGLEPHQAAKLLDPLVEAGMVVRVPIGHAFAHDRVLEAAYSLTDSTDRPAAHARVARVMIEHWHQDMADHAFEICNQIQRASQHPLTVHERSLFAHALIQAGRKAKSASLVREASAYAEEAFRLMDASWWASHFSLAYGAGLLRCECLLAQADLAAASAEIDAMLSRNMPPLERAALHRLDAVLQTVRSDYEGAINAALRGLALLDVQLKRHPTPQEMKQACDAVYAALAGRSINSLGTLQANDDPRLQTVMGLLATLLSAIFIADGISFLHLAKMVELTLAHGATAESPYAFAWFGVYIASLYNAYEEGLAFGEAALSLVDAQGFEAGRISVLVALDQVGVWTRPLSYSLSHAQTAATKGLDSGDISMACYAANHIVSDLLAMGEALPLVKEAVERGLALTRTVQYVDIELILEAQDRFVHLLRDGVTAPSVPSGQDHWIAAVREDVARANSQPTQFWAWLYGGMAAVYLGRWLDAVELLEYANALAWTAPAHINVSDCALYLALAHAQACHDAPKAQRVVHAAHRQFQGWAAINPTTFQSKLLLIEALQALLDGDIVHAIACLDQSATAASAAGLRHEEALAHELASGLCHSHRMQTAALQHAGVACRAYALWGADHKAQALLERWPQLQADGAVSGTPRGMDTKGVPSDWELGLKAVHAMSEEAVMDRLIETLLTDILKHAGANYGLLLLMQTDQPVIEASARVTGGTIEVTLGKAAPSDATVSMSVLNTVLRTRRPIVLADAAAEAVSLQSTRNGAERLRSVLCLPLVRGGTQVGAIYLENNLAPGAFNATCVAQLEIMAPQMAIALETARLYRQVVDEGGRRLAAEVSLHTARSELVKNSHLTLLANLSASIAHEVNQPLASIVTSAEASLRWLNRPEPDAHEVAAGLHSIREDGLRAASIVRALRTLAKQAPSQLLPLNVDDVIHEVLSMMHGDLDAGNVTLESQLSAGVWTDADRVQIQQVILNLLTNALEEMIEHAPAESRRTLLITTKVENGQVLVRVADSGRGIAQGAMEKIFDPFFTTKANGLGMGLPICRTIVEAHGGTLEAQPRDEGGTVMVLRLPTSRSKPSLPTVA